MLAHLGLQKHCSKLYSGYHLSVLDLCTVYQTTVRGKGHHYIPRYAFKPSVPKPLYNALHTSSLGGSGFPGSRCTQGDGHRLASCTDMEL